MERVRLKWKGKKCAVAHVNRGCLIQGAEDLKIENAKVISSLEEGGSYKFLGVLETEKRRQNCSSKCSEVVLAKVIYYLV